MRWFQAAEAKLKADLDGLGALREPGKVSLESLECLSKSWRSPRAGDTKVVSVSAWCLMLVAFLLSIPHYLLSVFFPSNGNSIPFDVWACCLYSSEDLHCFSRIRPKALPWMPCHWHKHHCRLVACQAGAVVQHIHHLAMVGKEVSSWMVELCE